MAGAARWRWRVGSAGVAFLLLSCLSTVLVASIDLDGFDFGAFADLGSDGDPLASLVKDFASQSTKLRGDRDTKREAYKLAEANLKQAKSTVKELELQLEAAKAELRRNETLFAEAKEAKQAAEKAVLSSLTQIAGDLTKTAEEAMGIGGGAAGGGTGAEGAGDGGASPSPQPEKRLFDAVRPAPNAEVILWESRGLTGKKVTLSCCGHIDLSPRMKEAGIYNVRSISMPPGMQGIFQASSSLGSDKSPSTFELSGSLRELDSTTLDFTETCCGAVLLRSGIQHSEDDSVVLYEEEGFQGRAAPYLEGDFGAPPLERVRSVRVPAGLRVTLRAAELGASDGMGMLGILTRDSRTFPHIDTSTSDRDDARKPPVRSLSVRRLSDKDLHGMFAYPEKSQRGRPQHFASGSHYLYPESWPPIRSVKVTNRTFARLFAAGLKTVRRAEDDLDGSFSRPLTIEVAAICEPADFCGPHGRCIQPQRCSCSGPYQGERCHLQIPDETSAIVCSNNIAALGQALPCRLHLRRDGLACNATSLFLAVGLKEELQASGELLGGPVIRAGGIPRQSPQEADNFDFHAVFNRTGRFPSPFEFQIFGKATAGMFVPQLEVVPRCDEGTATARVRCGESGGGGGGSGSSGGAGAGAGAGASEAGGAPQCAVEILRPGSAGSALGEALRGSAAAASAPGEALRCPLGSVRLFAQATGRALPLSPCRTSASSEASEAAAPRRLCFTLPKSARRVVVPTAKAADGKALLRVEIQHGPDAPPMTLAADVEGAEVPAAGKGRRAAQKRKAEQDEEAFQEAQQLLRVGDTEGALRRLQACAEYWRCAKLRRLLAPEVLVGRGAEAGEGGKKEGEGVKLDEAGGLLAAAERALDGGDFEAALAKLREARRWRRLMGDGRHDEPTDEGVRTLRAMGLGLLGLGLTEGARYNLRGCVELAVLRRISTDCGELLDKVAVLAQDVAAVRAAAGARLWTKVVALGASAATSHTAWWPAFGRSVFGAELDAARCVAASESLSPSSSLFTSKVGAEGSGEIADEDVAAADGGESQNASFLDPAAADPCRRVSQAQQAIRERLAPEALIKCHIALARSLEGSDEIEGALSELDSVEEIIRGVDDEEELLAACVGAVAEARVLRERLARTLRRRRGENFPPGNRSAGGAGGAGAKEEEERKPRDHYEVLGLARNASLPEIKAAYRKLALKYHPDKNPDPQAVPIFLDVQQAYQVLSDEALRRKYDAGQDVDDEAGNKNMKPMQYRVVEVDRERGITKVWWFDPNTGEEGFMEMETPEEEEDREANRFSPGRRTLHDHCCLPSPEDGEL